MKTIMPKYALDERTAESFGDLAAPHLHIHIILPFLFFYNVKVLLHMFTLSVCSCSLFETVVL